MKKSLQLIALLFALAGFVNAQTIINFETGDFSQYPFNNDPTYPWTVEFVISSTGNYCMQSGNAGVASSTSAISASVEYGKSGYITFEALCRGEGLQFDVCAFSIDGEVQFEYGADQVGWNTYGYNVEAGTHIFEWSYTKDNSVDPDGDYMRVDNIIFGLGTACIAPTKLEMPMMGYMSWNGCADSYTLRYKKGSGNWTTIDNIEENYYQVSNLAGNYTIEVKANCGEETWVTGTFFFPESTADWYGYIFGDGDVYNQYIRFSSQDPGSVAVASDEHIQTYEATYANGYVWSVGYDNMIGAYQLCKSPLDVNTKTIGEAEVVIDNYNYVTSMAINMNGEAYAVDNMLQLCTLNLSNATLTPIDDLEYPLYLAFDLLTNELFGKDGSFLYFINKTTAEYSAMGQIFDGTYNYYPSCMFMAYGYDSMLDNNVVETLNVYPNPANNALYIEGIEGQTVRVYDNMGRLVMEEQYNGSLNVSNLAQGIYAVTTGNNVVKFVKE